MSTELHRRYSDERQFQKAVKTCLDDQRLVTFVHEGKTFLGEAVKSGSYELFTQATAAFDKALAISPDNAEARAGRTKSIIAHSKVAGGQGEYALAESVLQSLPEGRQLTEQLNGVKKKAQKAKRRRRNSRAFAAAGALLLLGALGYAGFYYHIQRARNERLANRELVRHDRMMQDEFYLVSELGGSMRGLRDLVAVPARTRENDLRAGKKDLNDPYIDSCFQVDALLEQVWGGDYTVPRLTDLAACHAFCRRVVSAYDRLTVIQSETGKKSEAASGQTKQALRHLSERIGHILEYMRAYREKYMDA